MDEQRKIVATYDNLSESLKIRRIRERWDYLYSKVTADYYLIKDLPLEKMEVLNVGCSLPLDELFCAHRVKKWTSIDLSQKSIQTAKKIIKKELSQYLFSKFNFIVEDATELSFHDETFDLVVSFSVLDHIPERIRREKAIMEMARVVKKGGYIAITVPNRWNILYYLRTNYLQRSGKAYYCYEYCFSPLELKKIMKKANLKALLFSSNFTLPFGFFSQLLDIIFYPIKYLGFRVGYLGKKL